MRLRKNVLASMLALALPLLFSVGAKADENDEKRMEDEQQAVEVEERASQKTEESDESNVFTLGQITVTGQREDERAIATSTISSEEMRDFSKESLKEALDIVPGVSVMTGTGNRNWEISLAARNLFDKNYELTSSYPEEGRSFLLSTRFQF